MRKKYFIIVLLTLSLFALNAQGQHHSQEFIISFSQKLSSDPIRFDFKNANTVPFVGLSAYCEAENVSAQFSLRFKKDNTWSEWQSFWPMTDGYTPGRSAFEGPFLDYGFSAIEFRSDTYINEPLVFRLFYPDPNVTDDLISEKPVSNVGLGCNCKRPSLCRRNCWCPSGQCAKHYTPSYTNPSHIIIHHSAGHNSSSNYKAVVAYYWDLHVNTNGWSDIGYNWLIDPNGVVYEGRGDRILGAHFSCMNSKTVGICLIGNYETAYISHAAEESLIAFLGSEMCKKHLDPLGVKYHRSSELNLDVISGHRDGNNSPSDYSCAKGTSCPGKHLYSLLPDIRIKVSELACLNTTSVEPRLSYKSLNSFLIIPNPSSGDFHLSLDFKKNANTYRIEILDALGRSFYSKTGRPITDKMLFSFSDLSLPQGQYLIRVSTNEEVITKRFIVNSQY